MLAGGSCGPLERSSCIVYRWRCGVRISRASSTAASRPLILPRQGGRGGRVNLSRMAALVAFLATS
jgi:hypothetical protein